MQERKMMRIMDRTEIEERKIWRIKAKQRWREEDKEHKARKR